MGATSSSGRSGGGSAGGGAGGPGGGRASSAGDSSIEQCRIIVEDVTSTRPLPSTTTTSLRPVPLDQSVDALVESGGPTSGEDAGGTRRSSLSSAVQTTTTGAAFSGGGGGGPLATRRGSLSPVNRRPSSSSSWSSSWGSFTAAATAGSVETPAASGVVEPQFWVPPSVMQRSRARSLVPPTTTTTPAIMGCATGGESPGGSGDELHGGHSCQTLISPLYSSGDKNVFTFNQTRPVSPSLGLLECPPDQRRRRASMHDALDHTQINASLYDRPPMLSCQNPMFNSIQEENLGCIQFSLAYDADTSLLTVGLIRACDLIVPTEHATAAAGSGSASASACPFVRLCLLPDVGNRLQTRVRQRTTSPFFDEEFIFEVAQDDLASKTVEIKVFYDVVVVDDDDSTPSPSPPGHLQHHQLPLPQQQPAAHRGEPPICIGQVLLPLDQVDLSNAKVTMWKGISACEKAEPLGDVMFSLSYLPSAERLTVVVVGAKNLRHQSTAVQPLQSKTTVSNVFVKAALSISGKKHKKKKTSTVQRQPGSSPDPVWNEALVFSGVARDQLQDVVVATRDQLQTTAQLELVVYGGHDEPVGKATLGPGSPAGSDEHGHWIDMLNGKPAVARWHHLLPVVDASSQQQQQQQSS